MANRTRNIVLRVPVTPEERALIQQKMAQLHTKNFSAYARKMLIDGYIVHMDTSDIRAQTAELQKIGVIQPCCYPTCCLSCRIRT